MKTTITKMILIGLGFIFFSEFANSQGLENIIVEKYYVSDANDSTVSADNGAGILPKGSVTYRIFVDMLPGYSFLQAFGSANHPLSINTTTSFYNNEDRGSTNPIYTKTQAGTNTVMLDSWLSVGAACAGNFGILKSEDSGLPVSNSDDALVNDDASAGIPLTTHDGIIAVAGRTPATFGKLGLDSPIAVFDATSQAGNSFSVTNGSWYCFGGSVGPDSAINKVLIAQITTNGVFSFELNIQLGTPTPGDFERYVAKNPVIFDGEWEIQNNGLIFNSDSMSVSTNTIAATNCTISVFPNPSNGIINMNINSIKNNINNFYTVYDMLSNVLLRKNIESTSGSYNDIIDMSSFANGIYVIEVSIDGVRSLSKLIKN